VVASACAAPAKAATESIPLIVSADGQNGAFKTVQAAVDSIPDGNTEPRLIRIKPGTYHQRITVPRGKRFITFKGDDADPSKVVLSYNLYASMHMPGTTQPIGTGRTASTNIDADDFTADGITFENTAGEVGQALALKTLGDRLVFRNCRMLGWQDTLCADTGRQYYKNCYIEGRVDFIFGGATCVFDHCTIHSKNGGYVTAARTLPDTKYGYIFLDCILTGDPKPVPTYLGRPWQWDRGHHAMVTFIRCKMGRHIRPEGWNPWDRPTGKNEHPEQTTRYSEFDSMDLDGKPLDVSKRVSWSHQLTVGQAAEYTVQNVLKGTDGWDPTTQQ
jgi:pectinesterase